MDCPTLSTNLTKLRGAALAVTCAVTIACADASPDRLTVNDWCWHHYRFAPRGALATDAGPESGADATHWKAWLGSDADAPADRNNAHREQRRLIDDFAKSGTWSDTKRTTYRAASQSEPTPDTVCETVGARIVVAADGSLPSDWGVRFLDPNDPAYSALAADASTTDPSDSDADADRTDSDVDR